MSDQPTTTTTTTDHYRRAALRAALAVAGLGALLLNVAFGLGIAAIWATKHSDQLADTATLFAFAGSSLIVAAGGTALWTVPAGDES